MSIKLNVSILGDKTNLIALYKFKISVINLFSFLLPKWLRGEDIFVNNKISFKIRQNDS